MSICTVTSVEGRQGCPVSADNRVPTAQRAAFRTINKAPPAGAPPTYRRTPLNAAPVASTPPPRPPPQAHRLHRASKGGHRVHQRKHGGSWIVGEREDVEAGDHGSIDRHCPEHALSRRRLQLQDLQPAPSDKGQHCHEARQGTVKTKRPRAHLLNCVPRKREAGTPDQDHAHSGGRGPEIHALCVIRPLHARYLATAVIRLRRAGAVTAETKCGMRRALVSNTNNVKSPGTRQAAGSLPPSGSTTVSPPWLGSHSFVRLSATPKLWPGSQ